MSKVAERWELEVIPEAMDFSVQVLADQIKNNLIGVMVQVKSNVILIISTEKMKFVECDEDIDDEIGKLCQDEQGKCYNLDLYYLKHVLKNNVEQLTSNGDW